MIYIVCVTHTIYWFNVGSEPVRSLLLFEMPIIFFISGTAYSRHTYSKTLLQTITNRLKRIIVPFYIFLTILFILLFFGFFDTNISTLNYYDVIKILASGGCEKIPYYGYTWFISVYFIISCSLFFQQRVIAKIRRHLYVLICLIPCIMLHFVTLPIADWVVKEVIVYNFFFITGYLYYRNINFKLLISVLTITLLPTIFGFYYGMMIPMQDNKFPPNIYFLIFSVAVLCTLSVVFTKVKLRNNIILRIWNKHGYTIYLYQCISHYIVFRITNKWIDNIHSELVVFILYFVITFCIATLLSYIFYPIERYMMKIMRISTSAHT